MKIVLGTRGSSLALIQASFIIEKLQQVNPEIQIKIQTIKTKGDQLTHQAISQLGDKGLFVKELESALADHQIDMAVHSAKDLPGVIPDALELAAFPRREDPSDVLVTQENFPLDTLPHGAVLGTSSLRRQSQLLHYRPDLVIHVIRGNVDTRLRKLSHGKFTGVVVARAGLNRLNIMKGYTIPTDILLPAPGQGALAVEIRKEDRQLKDCLKKIDHEETRFCVTAERSLLITVEGGCQIPLGGLARLDKEKLFLEGFLGTPDGKITYRDMVQGHCSEAKEIGKVLAKKLLKKGRFIVEDLKRSKGNP